MNITKKNERNGDLFWLKRRRRLVTLFKCNAQCGWGTKSESRPVSKLEISVLVCFSVAVTKYDPQATWGKRVYFS